MTAKPKTLTVPVLQRTLALKKLEYEAREELFDRVLHDIAQLIAKSEWEYDQASRHHDQDLAEYVFEDEAEYIEELIGSSFLVMQKKVRRVIEHTKKLEAAIKKGGGDRTPAFADDGTIKAIGGNYKIAPKSLTAIVWEIGNYYKHRDEWRANIWLTGSTTANKAAKTRELVQLAGVEQYSSGNMRKCLEYFDINPYSNCADLGKQVQTWTKNVLEIAKDAVDAARLKD